jgi:hypothetical protein
MATFLFWNLNRKPLQNALVHLCQEYRVDVLVLAESEIPEATLLEALNRGRSSILSCQAACWRRTQEMLCQEEWECKVLAPSTLSLFGAC